MSELHKMNEVTMATAYGCAHCGKRIMKLGHVCYGVQKINSEHHVDEDGKKIVLCHPCYDAAFDKAVSALGY